MNMTWKLRANEKPRRGGIDSVLLRKLPGDTVVHRIWTGTKLIALAVLTIATGLNTGWPQLIALALLTAIVLLAARVPWRAWPRVPAWFWIVILAGWGISSLGHNGAEYIRLMGFTLVFLVLALVVAWTTELGELAPTLRTLAAPLRRVGAPVDQWAISTALAVRSLSLVLDECRVVFAARRQRTAVHESIDWVAILIDTVTASMSAAVRRGNDLGEVIALRGGVKLPRSEHRRPGLTDLVALVLVLAVSIGPAFVK